MAMSPALRNSVIAAISGGAIAIASVLITGPSGNDGLEGVSYIPYKDIVGVWTVCHGHTGKDIMLGKTYTEAECKALLNKDLATVARQINPYIKVDIPETTRGALYSFVYNVGAGSSGSPALGADIRSRVSGGDQRKLYNAAQRIQGKMQNQGIAAARDMGASGINTVAEAKLYFQGMPQVDFSSPEALQQSMRDIQQYTDNYNQQYNVNVGKSQRQQSQPTQVSQPAASSNFSSLWGD